jgi:hypothetical protein
MLDYYGVDLSCLGEAYDKEQRDYYIDATAWQVTGQAHRVKCRVGIPDAQSIPRPNCKPSFLSIATRTYTPRSLSGSRFASKNLT